MVLDKSQLESQLFSLKRNMSQVSFSLALIEHLLQNYHVDEQCTSLSLSELIECRFRVSALEKAKNERIKLSESQDMEKVLELAKNKEKTSKDSLTAADFASSFAPVHLAAI